MDDLRVGELRTVENLLQDNQRLRKQCRGWKQAFCAVILIGCGALYAARVTVSSAEDKSADRTTFTHKTTKDTPYYRHQLFEMNPPFGYLKAGSKVRLVSDLDKQPVHFVVEAVANKDNFEPLGAGQ